MADTKISLLTALTQAGMDPSNDLVPIVDSVGVVTKSIRPKLLVGGASNDMAQTWDNAGTTFTAIKMAVTDTNSQAASLLIDLLVGGASKFKVGKSGTVTLADAANVVVDSTTGTKIGTATTQKLGFWNATPVVQQAHIVDAATNLKTDYTTLDLDTEAEIIAALNTTNTRINAIATTLNTVLARLETFGFHATS